VVNHRVPRWRLGVLVTVVAALFIGLLVVAPIMTNSAVAGMESAVGQAETQQQQLAADTAALSSQISSLSSPQRVAEQAAQLGLVPANDVSYLASGEQMLASEGDTTVAGR
jgi:cell division protein FtsL